MGAAKGRDNARTILWSMTLANAMILVDQTAVPLALPNIMQDFGVASQQVQWVLNASLLPLAGLLVLGGRLGDMFGRRRIFMIGTVVFAGASAVGGLAPVFAVLLACRILQGAGGALMLPNTVAIVSAAFAGTERGRALGLMGGVAAVAGALGPTIGGTLTAAVSWRAVLLVNCPLAVLAVAGTLRAVPPDTAVDKRPRMDIPGTVLLTVALVSLVFGLSQSQAWGWASPGVLAPLIISVCAAAAFLRAERAAASPLMNLRLLRRHPNYLGATISQFIAGTAEMGLALLLPLLLILNLQMSPALAGLALIPTTVPMVFVAPLAGRWYDHAGGRPPLIAGFATLLASTVLLAWSVHTNAYLSLLPGLLLYGIGLALVLTVNDPVTLDTVPEGDHGQASGVSATAEQFGGAVGIAGLYLIFHATYLNELQSKIALSPLPRMTAQQAAQFKNALFAAESTGLRPTSVTGSLARYLLPARAASEDGYTAAFVTVGVACLAALFLMIRMIRKPPPVPGLAESAPADSDVQPPAQPTVPFPPISGYGAAQPPPQPQPRPPAPRRSKPGRASRTLGWLVAGAVAIVALIVIFSPSGGGSPSSAPTATASAAAKPSASPSCTLTTTFDYIERTTEPGLQPQADEIGNVDYVNCTGSLSDFAAEAGQAEGECTTIALASDNPGYDVNESPAPPLKGIIESAGPGC